MASTKREILEPETLACLGQAFDEAWATLSTDLALGNNEAREQARLRLAAIFIELVKAGQLSPQQMKSAAIRAYSEPGMSFSPEQVGSRPDVGAATLLMCSETAGKA
jgi:hypothetical protein